MLQVFFCASLAAVFWTDAYLTDGIWRWTNVIWFVLFVVQGCRAAYYAAQDRFPSSEDDD